MAWNPAQYERFRDERSQPFSDLLALVRPAEGMRAVDLGCGTGELTRQLHERLACARTVGYELSDAMLAKSGVFAGGELVFEKADIASLDLPDASVDLVLSNAALHWVGDHPRLFAKLARWLAPGGQLAIQVPANFDHPSHTVAVALAREAPYADALGDYVHHASILAPAAYAELLHALGFAEQHVRLQVYGHVLPERAAVVEWVKGTFLTPYKERLGDLYPRFLADYTRRLLPLLGDAKPYFYAFKRVLLWAR